MCAVITRLYISLFISQFIKVCVGFCCTTMKLMGKFFCSRISSLVRGLLPIRGSSRIVLFGILVETLQLNYCHVTFLEMFFV